MTLLFLEDLIGEFRDYTAHMVMENKRRLTDSQNRMRKLEKALNRITGKDGRIGLVVQNNIEGQRQEIGGIEENIKFLNDCLECLGSYHYKYDEPPVSNFTNQGGFYVWGGNG